MLKQATPEAVTKANILLSSASQITSSTESSISIFASYPTPWVHHKTYDIVRSENSQQQQKLLFPQLLLFLRKR
ncbi:hypothetical protein WJ0W_003215 [Paenibacillus melissococcoides]|uniref:Uncharacterized protein n=1 Tax=Paenibacillus melissococcoides TaxID=2912268 RepID=A0ABM9G381_9BACL|nr:MULTISPECIES: hypothetical protein [Paenibacillus]MEB9894232.1 hypothetical protein [Bacillus cereus]CAH8245980.1 hypothetical protein WJ0W_003215 [Paenibacillus melissococcoides]CAH8712619.1 hypothetical protein WDD9_003296 [Paenibacillus melissococcoides]CAH8713390.1 hypothetical protein HTL2_003599 [Paenibacillus melissococcoides]